MSKRKSQTIIAVRATPVTVPTKSACAWSLGTSFGFTRTILELETNEGIVGLGECQGSAASRLFEGGLGRNLIGLKPFDLIVASKLCHMGLHDHGCLSDPEITKAYAAIEMAMLDLQGKICGCPVFDLLGGAVRPRAEFVAYGYSFHLPSTGLTEKEVPTEMAKYAKEAIQRTGSGIFEFKIGRFSTATDIETIKAVREAVGPDIELAVDANQAIEIGTARKLLQAVEAARLSWFEEPVSRLSDMAKLHHEFRIAISCHCTEVETMKYCPDIEGIVGDLHLQGGMRGMMRAAAVFHSLGFQFWQRSSLELGISWAAMIHAGVSVQDGSRPSQCLIDYVEDDLILGPRWLLEKGGFEPPDLPGLGVELDREAMGRYAESYKTQGDMGHFDQT
jgi:glucarate dehydratase